MFINYKFLANGIPFGTSMLNLTGTRGLNQISQNANLSYGTSTNQIQTRPIFQTRQLADVVRGLFQINCKFCLIFFFIFRFGRSILLES